MARTPKWLTKAREPAEWWFLTAMSHAHADNRCDRPWVCSCGPCRTARKVGPKTTAELLHYGAARIVAYQAAMGEAP